MRVSKDEFLAINKAAVLVLKDPKTTRKRRNLACQC